MDYRQHLYEKYHTVVQLQGEEASTDDFSRLAYMRQRVGDWILPRNPESSLLDVGCGDGTLLWFWRDQGYTRASAIDRSKEQVEKARSRGLDVVHGDALEYLKDTADRFDLITAFDLVEHLTKEECILFFSLCFAALRPSGRLVIQTPNGASPLVGSVRYGDFTHEICLTPRSARALMNLAGFRNVVCRSAGPLPKGMASTMRWLAWGALQAGLRMVDLLETGVIGEVYTRVFYGSGVRP